MTSLAGAVATERSCLKVTSPQTRVVPTLELRSLASIGRAHVALHSPAMNEAAVAPAAVLTAA